MTSDIWLITGGGRSGKSAYAEGLAEGGVLYIATAIETDGEMAERIAIHRAARPQDWITWERHSGFEDIEHTFSPNDFDTILLDCVGNLLMGILFEEIPDADEFASEDFDRVEHMSMSEADKLCAYARKHGKRLVFVTNEVGMGIIPGTRYSRYYRDALGRINKHIAKAADKAVLMVSGIPMTLK
ncbi:MAG: bifunctional adenosylcobinamide kinase/adenosylcobinamide-phosphate guanylyltransferase [Clostridiales bacterium]|nr:bifunctional adenosylcobinamide kinase/adenosylcobinamide-phosphate guanylyltransferase [Clostridiales bacterium]